MCFAVLQRQTGQMRIMGAVDEPDHNYSFSALHFPLVAILWLGTDNSDMNFNLIGSSMKMPLFWAAH